jgi:hypothetical protein
VRRCDKYQKMKNKIWLLLSTFFFVLCGFSFAIAIMGTMEGIELLSLRPTVWWLFTFVPLGAGLLSLFFGWQEKEHVKDFAEIKRFMEETRRAIRGHLKLSILFWILAYRREKVKSFDDSKREIIQQVQKEIPMNGWLEEMIKEIQTELARYK